MCSTTYIRVVIKCRVHTLSCASTINNPVRHTFTSNLLDPTPEARGGRLRRAASFSAQITLTLTLTLTLVLTLTLTLLPKPYCHPTVLLFPFLLLFWLFAFLFPWVSSLVLLFVFPWWLFPAALFGMAPQVGGSGSLLVPPSERMSLQAFTRALSKRRAAELSSLGIRVAQLPPEEEEQLQDEAAANMELDVETPSERDERLAREEEERILKEVRSLYVLVRIFTTIPFRSLTQRKLFRCYELT